MSSADLSLPLNVAVEMNGSGGALSGFQMRGAALCVSMFTCGPQDEQWSSGSALPEGVYWWLSSDRKAFGADLLAA